MFHKAPQLLVYWENHFENRMIEQQIVSENKLTSFRALRADIQLALVLGGYNCTYGLCPGLPNRFGLCNGCVADRSGKSADKLSFADGSRLVFGPDGIPWEHTVAFAKALASDLVTKKVSSLTNTQVINANPLIFKTPMASFTAPLTTAGAAKRKDLLIKSGHGAAPSTATVSDTRAVIAAIDAFRDCQVSIGKMPYYKWVDPSLGISRPMICSSVPDSPNWQKACFPVA